MASNSNSKRTLTNQFNLGRDRLYGRKEPRGPYQDEFEKKAGYDKSQAEAQSTVTMDRINDRLKLSADFYDPGEYHLPSADGVKHGTDQEFTRFLAKREGSKTFSDRGDNARIRRATKLGIDFTIQEGGTVHFILDGINMQRVAAKENHEQAPWKDVTGSELRYLKRNWERLKGGVKFYSGGEQVDQAPWEVDADAWADYKPGAVKHTWPGKAPARSQPTLSAPQAMQPVLQPTLPVRRTSLDLTTFVPAVEDNSSKRCGNCIIL